MSFVNYISYTRAVSTRIKPTQSTLPIFKGSSLNRKQNDKKNSLAPAMPGTLREEIDGNEELQPATDSLRSHSAGQRSTYRENKKRRNTERRKERVFSKRSRNKCREKIFALFDACRANFTFLTLTMIADCLDHDAQKCLNKFLTVLRQRYGLFSYVWVAERQDNGRIHFHFILDKRFPIQSINKLWVRQQYHAGITHSKYSYEEIKAAYESNTLHKLLNPVDVRTVTSRNALSGYLTQYITKNQESFTCAVWHCNRAVSSLFTAALINKNDFAETGTAVNRYTNKKGKTFVNKTHVVTDPVSGKTLAIINHIFNRDYFSRHFGVMNQINAMILQKINARSITKGEDLLQRFKFGVDDFNLDACEWLN